MIQENGGFELASTIPFILQANRQSKCTRHTIWEPVYQPYRTHQSDHKKHINIEKIREAYRRKMQKKILKKRFMNYPTTNVRKRHALSV